MRTVISKKDIEQKRIALKEATPQPDDYKSRLFKYIPSEVVALYLTLEAIVLPSEEMSVGLHWFVFVIGIVAVILYLWRMQKVSKRTQLLISTVAFIVWIFAIGGPFAHLSMYSPLYGKILLPVYTFLIPLIEA